MDDRTLDVTILSAEDLRTSCLGKTQPYAVVWIDRRHRCTTRIDRDGQHNPSWNERFSFAVPEQVLRNPGSSLQVEIYTKAAVVGSRLLGMASIPLRELAQQADTNEISMYQLRRRSGKVAGAVRLSVHMDKKAAVFYGSQNLGAYPGKDQMQGYGGDPQGYPPQQSYQPYPQGYRPPQPYPSQGYYPSQQGYNQQPYT